MIQIVVNIEEETPGQVVATIYGNTMIRSATPAELRTMRTFCDRLQDGLEQLGLSYAPKRFENTSPNTATFTNA